MTPNHLELKSADGTKLNLEALYQIAPSCFTEVKDEKTGELRHVVNFTTLRQLLGDDAVEDAPEMYQFTWPGKQEARREAARPITDTLRPCPEESVDWDTTQNLYIEGDNLSVLKLLQKGYMGKVKMIYIDPPYNTGNDFVYHDDFAVSQKEMDLFSGDVDEEGNRYRKNTDSNGRFHSDWCSMMYSRLMVCRSLLMEDGVIFMSIDDNEIENLRKISDEVFGSSNFVANIVWQKKTSADARMDISAAHDYILCYTKNHDIDGYLFNYLPYDEERLASYTNPDNDPRGPWASVDITGQTGRAPQSQFYEITTPSGIKYFPPEGRCWAMAKTTFEQLNEDNRIWFGLDGTNRPRLKKFISESEGQRPWTWWDNKFASYNQASNKELMKLFDGKLVFDNPKPTKLIKRMLSLATRSDTNDIVLDFFSGSCTTADAVMQANTEDNGNRSFICIQLPQNLRDTGNDFKANNVALSAGYNNICDIGKDRIRRAGKAIIEEAGLMASIDVGFRVLKLDQSNFENVSLAPKDIDQSTLFGMVNNIKADRNSLDLLWSAMLDWGVQLSLPMSKEIVDGCDIYTVNNGDLVACFSENVSENVVAAMADKMPLRVLFRDSCFAEDKAKINVFELFKQKLDWGDDEAIKNIRVI